MSGLPNIKGKLFFEKLYSDNFPLDPKNNVFPSLFNFARSFVLMIFISIDDG